MKRILLLMVALMAIGISSVEAQTVWGVRAGLSRPTVTGEGGKIDGKFGLEVGPVLYYSLKNNLYINSGAMFSIKSFDYEGYDYSTETLNMYYLDIPLYLGYNFASNNKVSFYAQAGPFVGVKLSENQTSGLKTLNAGLAAMLGVNLQKFKIELGYQLGLMNTLDDDEGSVKLNSLFLGVSYVF